MNLIPFELLQQGGPVDIKVNPENVCFIMPVGVVENSEIAGSDGNPTQTQRIVAGISFGGPPLPVNCTVEEAEERLSGI